MYMAYKWENDILYRQTTPTGEWQEMSKSATLEYIKESLKGLMEDEDIEQLKYKLAIIIGLTV